MTRTRYYRDLVVWQKAMLLAKETYHNTERFPSNETFGLRSQMRRSAVSVASNIAEGHGRLTDGQLKNSLGMARGSLFELETQIAIAADLKFLDREAADHLLGLSTETAKLINGLLGVLHTE